MKTRPLNSRFICVQSSVTPDQPPINKWFDMIDEVINGKPMTKKEIQFKQLFKNKLK